MDFLLAGYWTTFAAFATYLAVLQDACSSVHTAMNIAGQTSTRRCWHRGNSCRAVAHLQAVTATAGTASCGPGVVCGITTSPAFNCQGLGCIHGCAVGAPITCAAKVLACILFVHMSVCHSKAKSTCVTAPPLVRGTAGDSQTAPVLVSL